MSEPEATFHLPMICEVLDRLAHEIREARKVSAAQLEWFKAHAGNEDFNEKQLKRFNELDGSIKSAIRMAFEQSEEDGKRLAAVLSKAEIIKNRLYVVEKAAALLDESTT